VIARLPPAWPVFASLAFVALLTLVVIGPAPLVDADLAISEAFRGFGTGRPALISVVRVVTDVMSTVSFLAVGCTAAVLLAAGGQRRAAGLCAAITVAVPVLWGLLHWWLYRPRPLNGFVVVDSNGFPSGHTANAAAAALTAVLLLWPHLRRAARAVLVVAAVCFAVAVGLTRVVLLAHWPADVLGGWLLALAVVPPLAAAFGGRAVATDRAAVAGPATAAEPVGTPEPGPGQRHS
jgi:undecaprenyl-diphosphatase